MGSSSRRTDAGSAAAAQSPHCAGTSPCIMSRRVRSHLRSEIVRSLSRRSTPGHHQANPLGTAFLQRRRVSQVEVLWIFKSTPRATSAVGHWKPSVLVLVRSPKSLLGQLNRRTLLRRCSLERAGESRPQSDRGCSEAHPVPTALRHPTLCIQEGVLCPRISPSFCRN